MKNIKLIVNPTAGKGAAGESIPVLEEKLKKSGMNYELVLTEYPWHACELSQEAAKNGYDAIVAVGGDGTINETINGLMLAKNEGHNHTKMAIIPIGRGNDFSYGVKIPTDIDTCIDLISKGNSRKIDIGIVKSAEHPEGRYFGNGVGIGFDAMVGFIAAEMKLSGFLAYLVSAIRTMFIYSPAPVLEIVHDKGTVTLPFLMVSIMNGQRMGGGFMMAPNGDPSDGVYDICMAREVSKPSILGLIMRFMKGTQESHDAIEMIQTKKITAKAVKGTIPAHADGETLCKEGSEISIEIAPEQLEIISA